MFVFLWSLSPLVFWCQTDMHFAFREIFNSVGSGACACSRAKSCLQRAVSWTCPLQVWVRSSRGLFQEQMEMAASPGQMDPQVRRPVHHHNHHHHHDHQHHHSHHHHYHHHQHHHHHHHHHHLNHHHIFVIAIIVTTTSTTIVVIIILRLLLIVIIVNVVVIMVVVTVANIIIILGPLKIIESEMLFFSSALFLFSFNNLEIFSW